MRKTALRGVPAGRTLRKLVAMAALALAFLGLGAITQAQASCSNPSASPYQLTRAEARSTVYCLLNEQRSANGLPSLAINGSLGQAAQHHSRTMNARNFFGHTGDGTPVSRIRRAGYMKGASLWSVGESLVWGRGATGTPSLPATARSASASPWDRRSPASGQGPSTRPTSASGASAAYLILVVRRPGRMANPQRGRLKDS
jgi:hypothetical protein